METSIVRARAVVRGRVQMVGFRAFVQRRAVDASLRGTVRNRPDGTLEVVIQGPNGAVERMIGLLHDGPSHARVDAVDVEYESPHEELPLMTVTA
ncbi:MAG: acylphosphatase [Candidatus Dormibacteria bacterium]